MRLTSRPISSLVAKIMAEEIKSSTTTSKTKKSVWPSILRWIPGSTDHIIAAEKRLLSLSTSYTQEKVNIGTGPPSSKVIWIRFAINGQRFINRVTFDSKDDAFTLVLVQGYATAQGFFFRNSDTLTKHFRIIVIDQPGWGASSRPDFIGKSIEC